MMRILGPIMTFVNRPWKMYPVGVLFGFGFDTASSIALLALSAIAKRGPDGESIPTAHVVILPLLFTAGMSLIDSLDSILMLYSYCEFPDHSWVLFEKTSKTAQRASHPDHKVVDEKVIVQVHTQAASDIVVMPPTVGSRNAAHLESDLDRKIRDRMAKMNVMSGLSIILTLMSILLAFSISVITIMGLIGEQCERCRRAAEAPDGGGLAGSWWRAWAKVNDNSGYIGAAIVGVFLTIVAACQSRELPGMRLSKLFELQARCPCAPQDNVHRATGGVGLAGP
ncbi:putative NiCoT transporter (TC 2.A.52) family protein [Lyophyllum shimeji]|uniref:Nickel/cobalt efflux system n=1 Tax=Lyophyllum shimeji TaxID=47721 RepID=A0A9P3PMX0_LYOSH|nr:putative NiCoT transporter (TC 2.A.52) family protein [Lyophyllum shimeji]